MLLLRGLYRVTCERQYNHCKHWVFPTNRETNKDLSRLATLCEQKLWWLNNVPQYHVNVTQPSNIFLACFKMLGLFFLWALLRLSCAELLWVKCSGRYLFLFPRTGISPIDRNDLVIFPRLVPLSVLADFE